MFEPPVASDYNKKTKDIVEDFEHPNLLRKARGLINTCITGLRKIFTVALDLDKVLDQMKSAIKKAARDMKKNLEKEKEQLEGKKKEYEKEKKGYEKERIGRRKEKD